MVDRRGRGRRAAMSAAVSEPTAMIEPRMPYASAPLPYTSVAMRALVIWKFIPKVPSMKTMNMTSWMSGRPAT